MRLIEFVFGFSDHYSIVYFVGVLKIRNLWSNGQMFKGLVFENAYKVVFSKAKNSSNLALFITIFTSIERTLQVE